LILKQSLQKMLPNQFPNLLSKRMRNTVITKYSMNTKDQFQVQRRVERKRLVSYQKSRLGYRCYIRVQTTKIQIHQKK
jgi:hypothetical protein